ncbi:hypothetical protein, partial [Staphylococcus pseudintermedius]|uniref:hypothetical protein n=2 Tax=Staphylococcus pseudintermedius TaxID=283734 RepID=UPI001BDE4713
PYNHIHHNTLFKKVKIGRSSSVMSILIIEPLTNRRNPPKEELYLKTLSHKNMTDDIFNWARYNTNIELEKLKKIKRNNLTFVRTPDINKRRKLIVILDSFNIH